MPIPLDSLVAVLVSKLDDNLLEDWEYRASVMEFDALMPRGHAESLAMIDLLCRYPEVLQAKPTRIVVLQVVIDGATQYLLSADSNAARQYLVDVRGTEISTVNLADVIREKYNGLALLTTV